MTVYLAALASPSTAGEKPHVLLLSVDTLRPDRMSGYGHDRNTSPRVDALLDAGARFVQARTPAPLTAPAMASMLTSLHPHEHGSTRNGLRVRPNLVAVSGILDRRGYKTAAFVGNWTLRPELSGLDDFFETYTALLERKRWFGLAKSESGADDLNDAALDWLDRHLSADARRPFFLWVHYVEPHAPYQLQGEYVQQVGLKKRGAAFSPRKRYDTEIAYVDDRIGQMLDQVYRRVDKRNVLVIFVGDHGESLGEHGYWGHGRHVYDVTLHIPVGFTWPGTVPSATVEAPATLLDVAPTVLGLAGLTVPGHFQGIDWTGVLLRGEPAPTDRVTYHQAHRSSVQPKEELVELRQRGLLEVARVANGEKEVYRITNGRHRLFRLASDPKEKDNLVDVSTPPSPELAAWWKKVEEGLAVADELPPPSLSEEDVEALRALGYID